MNFYRSAFLIFIFLFVTSLLAGQPLTSWRQKTVGATSDTLTLDTLSIIPNTFSIYHNNTKLDSTQYVLFAAEAKILLSPSAPHDSLAVKYAVYPLLFSRAAAHKDQLKFTSNAVTRYDPFLYHPGGAKANDPFAMGTLNKSGSLSRGVSFGNTRDVSVNSSLNLQLSGKITDNIDLLMAATDDNLPIQPDGTTQQLQEFDRVFIQLSGKGTKLIAGDFTLTKPNSYFMNFNKRAQGISVTNTQIFNDDQPADKQSQLTVTGSAAVSKGKFARNIIQGSEGNQGPYRLHGSENELFIVVLSGTEKVYVDGRLLTRGQDNDYTINYNTAEVTFTAKQLITKDKRIVIEFQYSDRNYSRSLFHAGIDYTTPKYGFHFNAYSEQDNKNQPLQQALTDNDKRIMHDVGDTLLHAVVPGVDSIPFSGDVVMYKKVDTLVNAVLYNNVYVYSTNSDSAHFRLSFSYVGNNNGNYVQVSSAANGKVYKWVAPVNNILQGNYEPVILLVTPKKRQLVTMGNDFSLTKNLRISSEIAYSTNDLNTFSPYDSFDDHGLAGHFNIKNTTKISDSLKMTLEGSYEYVSHYFVPLERYRPVEFERDWNLGWGTTRVQTADQHLAGAGISFAKSGFGTIGYDFGTFLEGNAYTGLKHSANAGIHHNGFSLSGRGSFLNSSGIYGGTDFLRQRVDLSQKIFKKLVIGGYEDQEINRIHKPGSDTLQSSSLSYLELQGAISLADTTKHSFSIFYKQRTDLLPDVLQLHKAAYAENIGGSAGFYGNPNQQIRFTASYRRLFITSPLLTSQQPDNTLVGRMEYNMRAWKGVITASTFYEAGSGLQVKLQYQYIEVPTGQGNYTWTDYNGDGVKQLNEFEVALYPDQANYIRVYTPTNDYIKVYSNQFSQSLNLRPSVKWANEKGFKSFVARFSDAAVYRIDRKSLKNDIEHALLPQSNDVNDTTLVSFNATLRNTIAFNQLSSKFGMEYTWQDLIGKSLLTNGLETRGNKSDEVKLRWNFTKSLSLTSDFRQGIKTNASEFFSSRNYHITYYEAQPKFSIQPGTSFRVTFSYRYSVKNNSPDLGGEFALLNDFGTELKLSKLSRGTFNAQADYINIRYTGIAASSIAYEMLESLKPGKNFTWRMNWQRSLAQNLQLTVGYEGRKTPGNKIVHTGSVQVRAIF